MGEDDGDHAGQRTANWLQHLDADVDMLLHGAVLVGGEASGFVKNLAADVQLTEIVEQGSGADLFDSFYRQAHFRGDRAGVYRDAVGMVLGVFILGNEMAENHEDAVIGVTQFRKTAGFVLVQRAHGVGVDEQDSTPGGDVEPFVRNRQGTGTVRKKYRIVISDEDYQQHAAESGEGGVAGVRRHKRRTGWAECRGPATCGGHREENSRARPGGRGTAGARVRG